MSSSEFATCDVNSGHEIHTDSPSPTSGDEDADYVDVKAPVVDESWKEELLMLTKKLMDDIELELQRTVSVMRAEFDTLLSKMQDDLKQERELRTQEVEALKKIVSESKFKSRKKCMPISGSY